MQRSADYPSILTDRVLQRLERLAASFPPSIHGTNARANDALWIREGLVVAAHARRNVTQPPQLYCAAAHLACSFGYGLLNNPLTAFQRVRAALGGPARATRTGTFAWFKMSRVKSPIM